METPTTSSSVQQLERKYQVDQCLSKYTSLEHRLAVTLDRHKAVLAGFMRQQDIYLLPSGHSCPKKLEVSLLKGASYS